jgi:hypothetical protein
MQQPLGIFGQHYWGLKLYDMGQTIFRSRQHLFNKNVKLCMPLKEVRTVWAKVLRDNLTASVRTIDLNITTAAWLYTPNYSTFFFGL